MTVLELINILKNYNDSAEVLIEINHDELVVLKNDIREEKVTVKDVTVRADEETVDVKKVIVIGV
jgi:hypothetical protein